MKPEGHALFWAAGAAAVLLGGANLLYPNPATISAIGLGAAFGAMLPAVLSPAWRAKEPLPRNRQVILLLAAAPFTPLTPMVLATRFELSFLGALLGWCIPMMLAAGAISWWKERRDKAA